MNKICGIYKITSPSGKVYIGQSKDIHNRWRAYKWYSCRRQIKLYNSLKKYSSQKHKFDIIHRCDKSDLNKIEKYYIELYESFNSKYGLNLISGGGCGVSFSDETRKKISVKMKGRIVSEKTKKIMRSYVGKDKAFFGKKHTEKAKKSRLSGYMKNNTPFIYA